MILEDTLNLLKSKYKIYFENLIITDIRIGLYLTAVKLSDDSYGIASTLSNDILVNNAKKLRDFDIFSPSRIKGEKVKTLFETTKDYNIIKSLKMAVLNAISSKIISDSDYKIFENTDPVDLIDLSQNKVITIVGAFHTYIEKIADTQNKLNVLELNENALTADYKKFYIPAAQFAEVLPVSDIVIITGLTLINDTIDNLLSSVNPNSQVIITGPSCGVIPDILFQNNVKIIGATRILKPDLLFGIVGEGGAGYHLFKYCAQKISIVNE